MQRERSGNRLQAMWLQMASPLGAALRGLRRIACLVTTHCCNLRRTGFPGPSALEAAIAIVVPGSMG